MEGTLRLGLGGGLGNAGHAVARSLDRMSGVELGAVADTRAEALQKFREKESFRAALCERYGRVRKRRRRAVGNNPRSEEK